MSKKVKIFVIVVAVIAVLILIFSYVGNSSPATDSSGLSSSTGATTSLPGGGGTVTSSVSATDFTSLLSTINSISLDTSLFSDPSYVSLRDNPVVLGTAIIGRPNPFAAIGTDASTPSQASSLQVQTLSPDKVISTSAELGALITATSTSPTTVVFNYGTSDTFGMASTPITVNKNGTALFTALKLTPSTLYYVQAVAAQGSTTATGNIMTFTTPAK